MTHACGFIPLESRKLVAAGAGSQGGGTLDPTEPALGVSGTENGRRDGVLRQGGAGTLQRAVEVVWGQGQPCWRWGLLAPQ